MSSTISDLPDLAILVIFDNLPLLDLIRVNLVCRRWSDLRNAGLTRRRELYIVHDESDMKTLDNPKCNFELLRQVYNEDGSLYRPPIERIDRHTVFYNIIPNEALDNITELMPNIKVLRIIQRNNPVAELWKTKYLINSYKANLVDLTLWFWASDGLNDDGDSDAEMEPVDVNHDEVSSYFATVLRSINNLPQLRYLELNIQTPYSVTVSLPLDLPIFGQLRDLSVRTYGFSKEDRGDNYSLVPSFKAYAEGNTELREVILHNFLYLKTALMYSPRLAATFTEINIEDAVGSSRLDEFKLFCSRYTGVHDLSVRLEDISIATLATALAPMKQLDHLSLNLNFDPTFGVICRPNEVPTEQLTVIPSVKALSIFIDTERHTDIERMQLPNIFPNVQVILMRHFSMRCDECSYSVLDDDAESRVTPKMIHECMRLSRIPLKKFTKLRSMTTNIGPYPMLHDFQELTFTWDTLDSETYEEEVEVAEAVDEASDV